MRGDDLPLGIGQVTGIAPGLLSARRIPWACEALMSFWSSHIKEHRARARPSQHTRHGTNLVPPRDHEAIGSFIKHSLSLCFNL